MSDSLDDLAAFLMHHSGDETVSDSERLSIYAVVGAYQERDDDPSQVESMLRVAGARFAACPDHRPEWLPSGGVLS